MTFETMKDVFEELCWRFEEELRESYRQICLKLDTDRPERSKIKLVATTPLGPGKGNFFEFPTVFRVWQEGGYYGTVILPRIYRKFARFNWGLFHNGLGSKKPGGEGDQFQSPQPQPLQDFSNHVGATDRREKKGNAKGKGKGEGNSDKENVAPGAAPGKGKGKGDGTKTALPERAMVPTPTPGWAKSCLLPSLC